MKGPVGHKRPAGRYTCPAPDQRSLSNLLKFLLNSVLGEGSMLSVHVCGQGVSALGGISPQAPVSMGQRLRPVQVCDHR